MTHDEERDESELERQDAMARIVGEEEKVLDRVARTLEARRAPSRRLTIDYDAELLSLRDQIQEARMEDIPPLVEEMERLQQISIRRARVVDGVVDKGSPYFGRLVLEEDGRKREVLIGKGTFLDSKTGIRIVDWRDAPVSRIYYRYEEGDDFEEVFGGRDAEGDVVVRRSLAIHNRRLKRIGCPQGTFRKGRDGWQVLEVSQTSLSGGQGAAMRPESHRRPGQLEAQARGQLGIGGGDRDEDKHLGEITALIDRAQFDFITKPTTGLIVIQGGAGSGKTTIGLHRLAYLAYQDKRRFRPDKMLVVVFNDALVRYISRVLPALGVANLPVMSYEHFAETHRRAHERNLPRLYAEDTPTVVMRAKKHPVMLRMIDAYGLRLERESDRDLADAAKSLEGAARVLKVWNESRGQRLGQRLGAMLRWLTNPGKGGRELPLSTRHAMERTVKRARYRTQNRLTAWAEILTDRDALFDAFNRWAPGEFTEREVDWVYSWCSRRCLEVVAFREDCLERAASQTSGEAREEHNHLRSADGIEEGDDLGMDREDDTLLLRLHQVLCGPLRRKREALSYEHVFVDEAQDLSPVELAVVLDTCSQRQSVTLAGDVAQRLYMHNGFSDWKAVLGELGLDHVEIEPLRLSYRSTVEIFEFATDVLGPLRNEVSGRAIRHGAPVELFRFGQSGEAVAMLADALRNLARAEPLASIAVVARYPEQADVYYQGLEHAEVPNLRRIAEQDFPFRAGVDVTDVTQVKGLEFDYVILVEVSMSSYPDQDDARHLLHIGATRAAHQLWVTTTGTPSPLLPKPLVESAQ